MKIENVKGYQEVEHRYLKDLQSEARVLEHEKTKAKVIVIENDDENKVFKDPFANSIKGSFTGKFLDPHNTECSKI